MYKEKIFLLKKMSRKGKEEIDELSIGQIVELRMEIANVLKAHGLLPEKYLEDMDECLADKIMNQMTEQYFRKVFADKYCAYKNKIGKICDKFECEKHVLNAKGVLVCKKAKVKVEEDSE